MSLETAIAALTEALTENSELLRGLTAKAKTGTADAGKTRDEGDEEKPKRTRAAATTKPKAVTAKELGAKTSAFLEVENEDEYERRKAIVKKIVTKYDATKMSEIEDADDRQKANDLLEAAIAGEDPFKKARRDDDMA